MADQNPFPAAEAFPIPGEPTPKLAQVPRGKAVPWAMEYSGVQYPGEVIVADHWHEEMASPLKDDFHFRAIVLTQPQTVAPQWLVDPRVVCWLPTEPQGDFPIPTVLRESAATYLVAAGGNEHQAGSSIFAPQGYIISHRPIAISSDILSSVESDEGMLNRILSALMEATFGAPPIEKAALSKTITPRYAGEVFWGFFHSHPSHEALTALDSFAPALGLSWPESPWLFDPSECKVFEILRERLAQWRGDWPVRRLYQDLAQGHGLPWYLITLYLLSFIYHADPPVELLLRRGHRLTFSGGDQPNRDRVRAADIPLLLWPSGLENNFDRLRHVPPPPHKAVQPYALLISGELKEPADPQQAEHQDLLLQTRLQQLKENLSETKERLQHLAAELGEPLGDEIDTALKRLSWLANRRGYAQFYAVAQREYPSPNDLAKDMALLGRLKQLQTSTDEIISAKAYLEKAVISDQDSVLALDRLSLLQQMSLGNLVTNPHIWPSIATFFRWFKSRYIGIYQTHHLGYQRAVENLRATLERSGTSLKSLQHLNSLEKLGPALGQELERQYNVLMAVVALCPLGEGGGSLEEQPSCPACGLLLPWEPPSEAVANFEAALEDALRQQLRRLSSETIHMILGRSPEAKIERLMKVIQASDLVSLPNVLNDELVSFLRDLLAEEVIYTPPQSIFKELQERLSPLSEEEIEAAGREFAALLREAFAQAKRENPGKNVKVNPV